MVICCESEKRMKNFRKMNKSRTKFSYLLSAKMDPWGIFQPSTAFGIRLFSRVDFR